MEGYDVIVIGAGPAGLTAGIYAGRARLKTLVLEGLMPGGQVVVTSHIENYPGIGPTTGTELIAAMTEQMSSFGAELKTAEASSIEVKGDGFVVTAGSGTFETRTVIAASGTAYKKLGVPGEAEFLGRGVSYCATCDGPLYKDLEIAVVGGGDSALQEALYLTTFARKVYLIHRRDEFRAVPILQERVRDNDKIECFCSCVVERITGANGVDAIEIKNVKTGEQATHPVAGVFLFVGLVPRTEFLGGVVDAAPDGFILTNDDMKTNVRGILAAGDCRAKLLRQIATAVGDGATAAFAAQRLVEDDEW
ncbi:MAG: thioredoxin-disulfide reductase [Candidatus Eisenbacteria bacterium]